MTYRSIVNGFLLLALVACIAGRGASLAAEQASEEEAVAEIQKLGGKVARDENRPGKPVVSVKFAGPQVTDAMLEQCA